MPRSLSVGALLVGRRSRHESLQLLSPFFHQLCSRSQQVLWRIHHCAISLQVCIQTRLIEAQRVVARLLGLSWRPPRHEGTQFFSPDIACPGVHVILI